MQTAAVTANFAPERAHAMDGWVGVDQVDERNLNAKLVLDRFERKHGERPFGGSAFLCGYDIGLSFGIALGRMKEQTAAGLLRAMETLCLLPATNGAPGTAISFGPNDPHGYKGAGYLVLRKVQDGGTRFLSTIPMDWA